MNYVRPSDEQFSAALAEEMKCTRRPLTWPLDIPCNGRETLIFPFLGGAGMEFASFNPLNDRIHSRIAVDRCYELGFGEDYAYTLYDDATLVDHQGTPEFEIAEVVAMLRASPRQESYAVHFVLWHHNRELKPDADVWYYEQERANKK